MLGLLSFLPSVFVSMLAAGCLAPSGDTIQEKNASALEMRDRVLEACYEEDPDPRAAVEEAPGYLVFSNFTHTGVALELRAVRSRQGLECRRAETRSARGLASRAAA